MFSNLQVLRGAAALGVVFFHTGYRLAGDWHTEFFGDATFFVISGFIMCFITQNRTDDFLTKRLVRIVPLYWLCTAALLVVTFGFALFDATTWLSPLDGRPGEPLWAYVGRSLTFSPIGDKYPILNVGWSLNYEMYFYLLFAMALWINRRMAPLIVIGCLVTANLVAKAVCAAPVCHYLSFDYTQFFMAGIVLFYALRQFAPVAPRRSIVWANAALIAVCYGSQFVGPWWSDAVSPGLYAVLAAMAPVAIVAAALVAEHAGAAVTWRPLILIGDASYAIYLTHPILFEIMDAANARWLALPTPKDSIAVMLFYLVIGGAAGVLVHLYVENPMLRFIRRKQASALLPSFLQRSPRAVAAGVKLD